MTRLLYILALSLLLGVAYADGDTVTTTAKPTDWVLKAEDGTTVISRHPTREECEKAVPAGRTLFCDQRVRVTAIGSCSATAPETKPVLTADGFLVRPRLQVDVRQDGTWGPTMEEGYVLKPYPACWTMGLVPYTGSWHAPDLGTTNEPVCRPDSTAPECKAP